MPGKLARASLRVRQPCSRMSSPLMTWTAEGASVVRCEYLDADDTSTASSCSKLSSVRSTGAARACCDAKPSNIKIASWPCRCLKVNMIHRSGGLPGPDINPAGEGAGDLFVDM